MKTQKKVNFEVHLICKNCGIPKKAKGHFTFHHSGTISFEAYNLESECIYCSPKYEKYRNEHKQQFNL